MHTVKPVIISYDYMMRGGRPAVRSRVNVGTIDTVNNTIHGDRHIMILFISLSSKFGTV